MTHKRNPWRHIATRTVYENPWMRVEEHQVINPAGNENLYGKVCFRNQAVGVVPLDGEGNTWLVGQHRYTLGAYSWEIPEGGSPEGETPVETARRELEEETGLVAENFELLMRLHLSNSVTDEEGFVYVARDLRPGRRHLDETEDITTRKLPLGEAVDMVRRGEITDAMSVAALLRLAQE
ncbi:MAG TPA: NUDIX hydrolase [Gammaproteobacteria bacterium]|nr:NUDIX hydrolase [Gammaproteobacteria bacterium]